VRASAQVHHRTHAVDGDDSLLRQRGDDFNLREVEEAGLCKRRPSTRCKRGTVEAVNRMQVRGEESASEWL